MWSSELLTRSHCTRYWKNIEQKDGYGPSKLANTTHYSLKLVLEDITPSTVV